MDDTMILRNFFEKNQIGVVRIRAGLKYKWIEHIKRAFTNFLLNSV